MPDPGGNLGRGIHAHGATACPSARRGHHSLDHDHATRPERSVWLSIVSLRFVFRRALIYAMAIMETIGLWFLEAVALLVAAYNNWVGPENFGRIGVACLFGTPVLVLWMRHSDRKAAAEAQHRFIASAVSRGIRDAEEQMRAGQKR